jgi:diketogulonate reductase-like aldo/keto reductase
VDKVAQAKSKTAAQVALNWCISRKGIVTIPKANSVEHVKENCAASDFQLSSEELQLLNSKIRYHRRGPLEIHLRRIVCHGLQILGRSQ